MLLALRLRLRKASQIAAALRERHRTAVQVYPHGLSYAKFIMLRALNRKKNSVGLRGGGLHPIGHGLRSAAANPMGSALTEVLCILTIHWTRVLALLKESPSGPLAFLK